MYQNKIYINIFLYYIIYVSILYYIYIFDLGSKLLYQRNKEDKLMNILMHLLQKLI